jgi:hypothetical protein
MRRAAGLSMLSRGKRRARRCFLSYPCPSHGPGLAAGTGQLPDPGVALDGAVGDSRRCDLALRRSTSCPPDSWASFRPKGTRVKPLSLLPRAESLLYRQGLEAG